MEEFWGIIAEDSTKQKTKKLLYPYAMKHMGGLMTAQHKGYYDFTKLNDIIHYKDI